MCHCLVCSAVFLCHEFADVYRHCVYMCTCVHVYMLCIGRPMCEYIVVVGWCRYFASVSVSWSVFIKVGSVFSIGFFSIGF